MVTAMRSMEITLSFDCTKFVSVRYRLNMRKPQMASQFPDCDFTTASQCPLVCFYCRLMMWHYIRPAAAHNVLSALRHSSLPEGRSSYRVFHSNYPHIPESVAAIMAASGDGLSSTVRLRLAGDCAPTALHGSE